ncbi:MAG TPA: tetratricopeptide repeat protein [Polyangia bacterium]|nr:tetratricopeptide repeat protein [Polyangia bacterium]
MRRSFTIFAIVMTLGGRAAATDLEDAKAHYEKGVGYYALGKYAEAAGEYEKAFELKSDPALLYNAAQAHRLAGNKERALLLYQNYLRLFDKVQNRGEVQRHVAELKRAIETEKRAQASPPTHPISPTDEALRRARATETKPAEPVKPPVAVAKPRVEVAKPPVEVARPVVIAPPPERPVVVASPPILVETTPRARPHKKPRGLMWGLIGGGIGLAVVAIGVGIAFAVTAPQAPSPSIGAITVH